MKTLEMTVDVGPNRQLMVPLPPDIKPGRLQVVMVIEELPSPKLSPEALQLSTYPVEMNPKDFAFRREDIYGDDGR